MVAYLRIDDKGNYHIDVAQHRLNPIGTRLETPRKVFPEVVRDHVADPGNEALALRALRAMQGFFDGTEAGFNPPQFGDPLPIVKRKKK